MIVINKGVVHVFTCLFLLCVALNFTVLCTAKFNEAAELENECTLKFCEVPTLSSHTNAKYKCNECGKYQSKSCVSNGTVAELTVIKISCDPGYSANGEDTLVSVCYDNEWVPPITGCVKKCKKLNPVNVHLECFRKNISIPCDEKLLLPGVTVRPTCRCLNTSGFHSYPGHREIHCQEDGNWDNDLLSCVQGYPRKDCGQLPTSSKDSETWGMPWDVIIGQNDGKVCLGTIISPRVILTSEYCIRTNMIDRRDYVSMIRNPLDPTTFVAKIVNNLRVQKTTWIDDIKHTLSALNPFKEGKLITTQKVKEFRYFKHEKPDKSLFHDVLIAIMEKEINFNSHVYPACVQWEHPNRINISTGTAKVLQLKQNTKVFSSKDYSFLSHDACQANPMYPYFVSNWASLLYGFDKANRDQRDKTFSLSSEKNNQTVLHEGKLFCLEMKQDQLDDSIIVRGSGVMLEEEHRYFIRGIASERFHRDPSNNNTDFKRFMNKIHYIADNISFEKFSKNISDSIIGGSFDSTYVDEALYLFNYNFTILLRNHLKPVETMLQNRTDVLISVTDIADYVDWIRSVVAEVDPYYYDQ